jgi:hypothetical protein
MFWPSEVQNVKTLTSDSAVSLGFNWWLRNSTSLALCSYTLTLALCQISCTHIARGIFLQYCSKVLHNSNYLNKAFLKSITMSQNPTLSDTRVILKSQACATPIWSLTFRNCASYIQDDRSANLQMLHFIYLFNKYKY